MPQEELELYLIVGKMFRRAREESGMSLRDVAERIGVTHKTLQRYECGERKIKIGTIKELCSIYGLDYYEFVKDAKSKFSEGKTDVRSERIGALLKKLYDNAEGYSTELIEGLLQLTPEQLEMVNDFVQMLAAKNKDRAQAAPSVSEEME